MTRGSSSVKHNPPQEPKPGRLRLGLFYVTAFLVAPSAGAAVGLEIVDSQAVPDIVHATLGNEDAREQKISNALRQALGLNVSVHCTPPWATGGSDTYGNSLMILGHPVGLLHLQDTVCDGVAGDINKNLTSDDDRNPETAIDIMVISHEAAHEAYSDPSEAVTECYGYQNVPAVAKALGVTGASLQVLIRHLPAAHQRMTSAYRTPVGCEPGKVYDLHPGQADAVFPLVHA